MENMMDYKMITINARCNCYLINTNAGYLLIDTGLATKRAKLEAALQYNGCKPGNLLLILLTHGDPDHAGNALYLKKKWGAKIAMHADDFGMVEYGDTKWNRKPQPDSISPLLILLKPLIPLFYKAPDLEKFNPDLAIDEDFDLSAYGFDVKVLHLPGHSKGSIGILTDKGELFCGDLIYTHTPGFYLCDDESATSASLEKLKKLDITIVYPGHGKPFPPHKKIKGYRRPGGDRTIP